MPAARQRTARARAWLVLGALGASLCAALVAGVACGAVPVSPEQIAGAIARAGDPGPRSTLDALVWDLRIPRVLLAALVGACLAGAGTLYQALFRNPLADPYIIGVSSGAGLAATLALVLGAGAVTGRLVTVPLAAFAGALLTLFVVVAVSTRHGRVDTTSLLLSGVAVSYTLAAVTSFLMVFARETMSEIVFWMMGGLTSASWSYAGSVAPMLVLGMTLPMLYRRELNLMLLGDERAGQLGVAVERFKLLILGSASLMVAAAVSVSGLIGFIGLMTPHMARLVLGPDHRLLLPASALAGASAMVLADLLARVVLAPVELPVGIVTALLGGPFFVWLLVRRGERPG